MCFAGHSFIMAMLESSRIDPLSPWRPSEYLVQVYKELGQKSPFTPDKTTDDEELSRKLAKLLTWIPPDYIVAKFPHYFAGHSYNGNPVWIVPGGRFNINDLIRQGPEMVAALEIAAEQGIFRAIKSMEESQKLSGEIPRVLMIIDLEGLNFWKFSYPKAFALMLKMAYRHVDVGLFGLEKAIVINSSYFVETLLNVVRPVLGKLMERVEIYGCNKEQWLPRLQRLLPPSALPPWYGGDQDFKPLAAYCSSPSSALSTVEPSFAPFSTAINH